MDDNLYNGVDIGFSKGDYIDLLFEKEAVDYKLKIDDLKLDKYTIILKLDELLKDSFYKGEDLARCRYVKNNIVYEFGAEIIKLDLTKLLVYIKISEHLKKRTQRNKNRLNASIVCEYIIESIPINSTTTKRRGLGLIKDLSISGVSFNTSNKIPKNTEIFLFFIGRNDALEENNIVIKCDVKREQIVNGKYLYGLSIMDFPNDSFDNYKKLLDKLSRVNLDDD